MHATTKRKNTVRPAVASDDDSDDSRPGLKEDQQARKAQSAGSRDGGAKTAASGGPAKKKRKEFAWMDSDDEGGSDQENDQDSGDDAGKKEDAAVEEAVSVEVLDQVTSFGRMMLLAPSVSRQLRSGGLGAAEVAAVCRALARAKFFDRELLDELYDALRSMLKASKLTVNQTSDAVQLQTALNAYSRDVCSAIARCFCSRTVEMEAATRTEWLESFNKFGHSIEPDFLQLLEVPPVPPMHPNYRKVRCWHFSKGNCVLKVACTYSHDPRAPLSLSDGTKEDWWKLKSSVMMTQNQKTMGQGSYGTGPLGFPTG